MTMPIDRTAEVQTKIERDGLVFYDIDEAPFRIHGVYREGDRYVRMPSDIARTVSDGVGNLCAYTTGGRVRFITDSPYIAVSIRVGVFSKFPFFPLSGTVGCDLYGGTRYFGTYSPPLDITNSYEGVVDIFDPEERVYTVNMPLYSTVGKMYIGIKAGSVLKAAPDYAEMTPIVYYGSSITHGGCATRPGCNYESIIARKYDWDFINLGFAGCAKGEEEIARYIAGLPMRAFVYDYDHNAPTLDYYRETHERMFKIVRAAQPELPIIMMSRPKFHLSPEERERVNVMMQTYENALAAGDSHVFCIKGADLLSEDIREVALVDNCHPTDGGFASIAKVLGEKLAAILSV